MKKQLLPIIALVFALFLIQDVNAQTQSIIVDTTITSDCEIYPFSSIDTLQGLSFSGSVVLNSDSSLVRIVYIDGDNYEWLLMESYPMIADGYNITYSKHCDETCYFDDSPTATLLIEIIDASVSIDTFFCSTINMEQAPNLRVQAKNNNDLNKVEAINAYNQQNGLRWVADYNDIVGKWYFDKKYMLGEKYSYLGFEYYRSGVFETVFTNIEPVETDMVAFFDWRSRHGANDEFSDYYDGDDSTATGWLTPIKDQSNCGSCWAFSSTASIEATSNLYYNIPNLNPDLSEQELISCAGSNDCEVGGFPRIAFGYISNDSIDNEDCFPYIHSDTIICSDTSHCLTPEYLTTIKDSVCVFDDEIDSVIANLITRGPLQVHIIVKDTGDHGVSLIGYYYDEVNAEIFWLIENSWGDDWGDNGVGYISGNHSDLQPFAANTPSIVNKDPELTPKRHWYDNDGDGIYWWGIGTKPDSCPGNAYNRDCNDNDSVLGGYDVNYNCICLKPYQYTPMIIANDTTWWNADQLIDRDIEIDSGATLTIFNTVKMTDNARIIVKRGAKLVVNGGTITNLCTERWKGIEVWGTSDLPQENMAAHGIVELINGAIIENAYKGIETIKKSSPHYITQSVSPVYSGGIVYTNDAIFKNCETSIKFWPYPYNHDPKDPDLQKENISIILNTFFKVDDYYHEFPVAAPFDAMVYLNEVNGIRFENINMINQQNTISIPEKRGYGIYANNSTFNIKNPNTDSSFRNLTYGIFSIASKELSGYTFIRETEFYNNKTGVYISHPYNYSSSFEILFNKFKTKINGTDQDVSCGLYLDNTPKFIVEENEFYGDRTGIYPDPMANNTPIISYGIVINNCGPENNRIYNNYIYGCDRGIQAQHINRDRFGETGLSILCNDYVATEFDTYICSNLYPQDGLGVKRDQGFSGNDTKDPAGNTFQFTNNAFDNDILNNTNYINYWYHADTNGAWVRPINFTDGLVVPDKNTDNPQPYVKNLSCSPDTSLIGGRDAQNSRTEMLASENEEGSLKTELNLLVDDGDTEVLDSDVQNSWPDETMEVRQELLDASPYLSDTVMISVAEKEDVLPNSILTEVLVANPQSAKSDKVMDAVDERDTLLNQTQYDQVMQGKLIAGAKEKLESRLSAARGKREFAMKNLIMAWHQDTLINATDSIIELFENEERVNAKYVLVETFLSLNDTNSATIAYNIINTDFELLPAEYSYWKDYEDWFNYRKEQINNAKNVSEPDSLQLVNLYQLYGNTENHLKTALINVLRFADTLNYNEPYLTVDTSFKESKVRYRPVGNTVTENELLVYPNPARSYIIVDYTKIDFDDNSAILSLYTIEGKPKDVVLINSVSGFRVIDTRMWTPGAYVVTLKSRDKLLGSKTILVTQ